MTELIVKLRSVLQDGGDGDVLTDVLLPGLRQRWEGDGGPEVPAPPQDPWGSEFATFPAEEITTSMGADGVVITEASSAMEVHHDEPGVHMVSVERRVYPDGSATFRREETFFDGSASTVTTGFDLEQNQWSTTEHRNPDGTRSVISATHQYGSSETHWTMTTYDSSGASTGVTEGHTDAGVNHVTFPPGVTVALEPGG